MARVLLLDVAVASWLYLPEATQCRLLAERRQELLVRRREQFQCFAAMVGPRC